MTVAAAYAQQGLPAQHGLVQLPRLLLQQSRKGLQLRVAGCVGIREHRARRQLHGRGYLLQGLQGRARVPDGQRRRRECQPAGLGFVLMTFAQLPLVSSLTHIRVIGQS